MGVESPHEVMKPHEGGSSIHYFQSGSEHCTAECVLQNVCCRMLELQPAPGCAMVTASQTEQRPWPGGKQASPIIVSSTFSCIAKHSTLSFNCRTWQVVI